MKFAGSEIVNANEENMTARRDLDLQDPENLHGM